MPLDGNGFAHEHAEQEDRNGRPIFALPSQRFGPELHVDANLPSVGRYRLWGQFRAPDGQVITTTFTVQAGQ